VILALDNGLATLGWAVVRPRTGAVVELGFVESPTDPVIDDAIDRARRAFDQAVAVAAIAKRHACRTIVGEAMSFGGPPQARLAMAVSLGLSWGVLVAVAQQTGAEVFAVPPKVWQHSLTGTPDGEPIDYDALFTALVTLIAAPVRGQLDAIPKRHRNHAVDAFGIGLHAARRGAVRIAKGRPTA